MRRELKMAVLVAVVVLVGVAAVAGVGAAHAQTQTQVQDAEVCDFPYETPGGETVIEEEPERVVTLAPSVTQTVWEIEAQDKVVGVSNVDSLQYLDGVKEFADVGSAFDPSFPEQVVAQEPDHVVGALLTPDQQDTLEDVGIQFYSFPPTSGFEEIAGKVEEVGRQVGECEAAQEVADEMREDVDTVRTAVEDEPRPAVMYRIPSEGAFVPGEGTFIGDMIETAGGENVYAEAGLEGFVEIPSDETEAEIVLEQNPEWIVLLDTDDGVPENELYDSTTAVQENQILVVDENLIQQEGPRVTTPLERMARAFHPDAFDEDTAPEVGAGSGRTGDAEDDEDEDDREPRIDIEPLEPETFSSVITTVNDVTMAEFDAGPVEAVELGTEADGEVSVSVRDFGDAPGTPLQRVTVEVPQEARDSEGTVRMTVDPSVLEEAGIPVDDLVVVRQAEEDGGWTPLETTSFDTDDGVTLTAETPGFSDFAVVASTEPDAAGETTFEDGTVTLDGSASSDRYGEITSYVWNVDGDEHEGETVEFEADEDGEATLTVTNDVGLTDETTVTFSVEDEEADADDVTDEDMETEDGDEPAPGDDTEPEGMPGFTAVAAVVAVFVVLALIAARGRRR